MAGIETNAGGPSAQALAYVSRRGALLQRPDPTRSSAGGQRLTSWVWALVFLAIAGGVGFVALRGPLWADPVAHQLAWGLASAAWLAGLALARGGRLGLGPIVAGAVILRALALMGTPGLSDDIHRYVWEGQLVLDGISPYALAPDAPELAEQRARFSATYAAMNNTSISAAYPPATQWLHALVVGAARALGSDAGTTPDPPAPGALLALRGFFALCDLILLWPLARMVRARGRPAAALIAWAWCPLVALEFGGAGHFDVVGIFCVVAALALLAPHGGAESSSGAGGARAARERVTGAQRGLLGAAVLGVGIVVKWLPLLALPFIARGRLARAAVAAAVAALSFLPLLALEGGLSGLAAGLGEYGLRWEAGSLVHRFLQAPFDAWFERDGSALDARRLSRLTAAGLLALVGFWAYVRERDPVRATALAFAGFLVLSPTLHPWYAAWVVPFLALYSLRAFALLIALVPLLYWPLATWHARAEWVEPSWLWWAVAAPVLVLLSLDGLRVCRASARSLSV